MIHMDYLTVVIAALMYLFMRTLWFSKYLFKDIWVELREIKNFRHKYVILLGNFLVGLFLSFFLSLMQIYVEATSFWDGIALSAMLYLGFIFPVQITEMVSIKKSFKIFLFENAFWFLALIILGIILVG